MPFLLYPHVIDRWKRRLLKNDGTLIEGEGEGEGEGETDEICR